MSIPKRLNFNCIIKILTDILVHDTLYQPLSTDEKKFLNYSMFICSQLNIKNANATVIVSDIEKAISFYTDILGLELVQRIDNQYAVLKTEGLTIGLNPIQHGLQPGNCKSMSIGFLIDNLDENISELKNKGIVFSDVIVEPPLRIAYFTDQDKNPLYICEYLPEKNSKNK